MDNSPQEALVQAKPQSIGDMIKDLDSILNVNNELASSIQSILGNGDPTPLTPKNSGAEPEPNSIFRKIKQLIKKADECNKSLSKINRTL